MQTTIFKLYGLHCVSCSLNIDSELEDIKGVVSTSTSYARQETIVIYDSGVVKLETLAQAIEGLGYTIRSHNNSPSK